MSQGSDHGIPDMTDRHYAIPVLTEGERAGLLKLAEAMRLGAQHYGEVRTEFIYRRPTGQSCGCALGTAVLELVGAKAFENPDAGYTGSLFTVEGVLREKCGLDIEETVIRYPLSCGNDDCFGYHDERRVGTVATVVTHLHLGHEWSRERIAAYLVTLSREPLKGPVVG